MGTDSLTFAGKGTTSTYCRRPSSRSYLRAYELQSSPTCTTAHATLLTNAPPAATRAQLLFPRLRPESTNGTTARPTRRTKSPTTQMVGRGGMTAVGGYVA